MKTRFQFVLIALTLVGLFSLASASFAQDATPEATPEATPPAAPALRPDETVITLDNGVVGTLLQPASDAPVPAVLLLHGFASSRDEVGGMYQRLAAALADHGIASLRIDFRGWGDSAGGMENSTVDGQVADAEAAYNYLSDLDSVDHERIGLVGFSLGGGIAVYTAGEHPAWFKSMALWSTFGDLHDVFLEELGQDNFDTAAKDGKVTIDLGFRTVTLNNGFFESLEDYDTAAEFANYRGAFMVIAGSADGSSGFLDWYRDHAQGDLKASFLVRGADHIYNVLTDDQTNSNAVIEKTAGWFALSL